MAPNRTAVEVNVSKAADSRIGQPRRRQTNALNARIHAKRNDHQDNAQRNNVTIETYLPDACPSLQCDVLLANILAGPLIQLAPLFAELTHDGSDIVLSGILDSQTDTVHDAYQPFFSMHKARQFDDWMRLSGIRYGD